MTKYRVKETWRVTSWTYVEADTITLASRAVEKGQGSNEETIEECHHDTDWDSFEEVDDDSY